MKEKTDDSYKDSWYEQPNPLKYVNTESSK